MIWSPLSGIRVLTWSFLVAITLLFWETGAQTATPPLMSQSECATAAEESFKVGHFQW